MFHEETTEIPGGFDGPPGILMFAGTSSSLRQRKEGQAHVAEDAQWACVMNPTAEGQTMSLRFFIGRILTMFRAGLALNTVSSPVKGLMPLRALVAGLRITISFIKPGTV